MFKKWEIKNSSESENLNWIMANTKMCPQPNCRRPIEKNQGCNHMTCKVCGFEFCWICLGSWKEHNTSTGGYYNCNKFKEEDNESQKLVENAKYELQRYMFYFERYNNHQKSERLIRELRPVVQQKINQLHELKNYPY
jgi:ariadne-1